MHPIARPRLAILTGVIFAIIGIVYYNVSHDIAGAAMEVILAIAMSMMAYVLIAGSPRG